VLIPAVFTILWPKRLIRGKPDRGLHIVNRHSPRVARNARVLQLDRTLEQNPDAVEARYERARLSRELGIFDAAKRDYLELLRRTPTDFGVLNDFGMLVLAAGYTDAARSLFSEAVHHHPDNPTDVSISPISCSGPMNTSRHASTSKRRCGSIHITSMPIVEWVTSWPSSAMLPALVAAATMRSRIIS
jgi:tetratricopeptide (TPR) repeat protein